MGEDFSKIEDFKKPITPVKGAKIGLFWNVEACPFPDSKDPDWIHQQITSDIIEMGGEGTMSIWAYVDEKKACWGEFLRKKTWKARIYFLPGGDKHSNKRMLNDILLWVMDTIVDYLDPKYLVVVSDKVSCDVPFFNRLRGAHSRNYIVYIAEPTVSVSPESPEWPSSVLDQGYAIRSSLESEEGNPAKRSRVDGEGSKDQG